jgi:hypothetical protein
MLILTNSCALGGRFLVVAFLKGCVQCWQFDKTRTLSRGGAWRQKWCMMYNGVKQTLCSKQ